MSKKEILISIIVIAVIGIGIYFAVPSLKPIVSPGAPEETGVPAETEVPEGAPAEESLPVVPTGEKEFQGMKYEIISFGFSTGEIHRAAYDIITGKLTEEKAKTLAEKIIGDITTEDPSIEEIYLLFYSNDDAAAVGKYDVAYVTWVPNEITVKMIEE